MNNQTFEFDEHKDYLRLLLSEKNAGEVKNQLSEMNDFDVATFLTDLREDGEQLMVLVYLMLSRNSAMKRISMRFICIPRRILLRVSIFGKKWGSRLLWILTMSLRLFIW